MVGKGWPRFILVLTIALSSFWFLMKKTNDLIFNNNFNENGLSRNVKFPPQTLSDVKILVKSFSEISLYPGTDNPSTSSSSSSSSSSWTTLSNSSSSSELLILFGLFYLWKQTFAIPGSLVFNVMAGALFGPYVAIPLCCLLTAVGSTLCYFWAGFIPIDFLLGRRERFRGFLDTMRISVTEKLTKSVISLMLFLISARIFPLTPHWLMNMTAPLAGIPVLPFFLSTFIGMIPYVTITTSLGTAISSLPLDSGDDDNSNPNFSISGESFVALIAGSLTIAWLAKSLSTR